MNATFASIDAPTESTGPRTGADRGDPRMSLAEFYAAGGIEVGVWECTPGGWAIDSREDTEVVHILEGRVQMTDDDGSTRVLGPGDVMILPAGWSGRWDVLEFTRKLYVTVA